MGVVCMISLLRSRLSSCRTAVAAFRQPRRARRVTMSKRKVDYDDDLALEPEEEDDKVCNHASSPKQLINRWIIKHLHGKHGSGTTVLLKNYTFSCYPH